METKQEDYHISFFKPTTPIAKYNRNLVLWLVSIWAVAVFGFQILLRIVEKPVPEAAYLQYEQVWQRVAADEATPEDLRLFAQSCISVLGKNFIQPAEQASLSQALSWSLHGLLNEDQRVLARERIIRFLSLKSEITDITDPLYVQAKDELNLMLSPVFGLEQHDIRTRLFANELSLENWTVFPAEDRQALPGIMSKYLIHNQSFLTDFKVLGFPFHYFYTSVFLLILFVGLCWLYCIRIDRRNIVLGIPE